MPKIKHWQNKAVETKIPEGGELPFAVWPETMVCPNCGAPVHYTGSFSFDMMPPIETDSYRCYSCDWEGSRSYQDDF